MAFGLQRVTYLRYPGRLAAIAGLETLKRCTTGATRRAVVTAILELKVDICQRRGTARAARLVASNRTVRLNLGCGATRRPGWVGVDMRPDADLQLDLRRPLPFPDRSCAELYAEHVVEHLAYPGEVEAVLRDWYRILVPGGRVSVGVPDTAEPLACYVNGEQEYFDRFRAIGDYPPWNVTRLDHVNYHFRQQAVGFGQDHLYAYDLETLTDRLSRAGFVAVQRRDFDPERDSRPGTLYVDAVKPRA